MTAKTSFKGKVDRYFGVTDAGSSLSLELRSGLTTFLTMAYILFVNPSILSGAIAVEGVDVIPQLLTATALAAAIGTLLMALLARYPFALAPGMGLNAYFVSVVLGGEATWQVALGAVFISGIIFLALSIMGVREYIINSVPSSLKLATAAGIGLFLAIIGFNNAGLVVHDPHALLMLGDVTAPGALLALFGLLTIAILLARRWRGAILIGIALTSILAIILKAEVFMGPEGEAAFAGFHGKWLWGIAAPPAWPKDLFFAMSVKEAAGLSTIAVVFFFLFVDFFDTAGTLIGLSEKSGFMDEKHQLPRATAAFSADALATSASAILGTSPTTTYIESAAGIEEGGRTGLSAVAVAVLFLLSIFFWPLASAIPAAATAPALIVVAVMMMSRIGDIDWSDYGVAVPAFLTIAVMPLTFSIANGISFGIVSYTAVNLLSGKRDRVHPVMVVLSLLLIARYIWLG